MPEQPEELKKLIAIASDMQLPAKMRTNAIEQLGNVGSHDALLALLDLAANEIIPVAEREFALKKARDVIKKTSRQ